MTLQTAASYYARHLSLPMMDKEQEEAIMRQPQVFLSMVSREQHKLAMSAKARQEVLLGGFAV